MCQSPWYLWEIQGLLCVSHPGTCERYKACYLSVTLVPMEIQGLLYVGHPGTCERYKACYLSVTLVPMEIQGLLYVGHPGTCERYKACYLSVTLVPMEIQGLLYVGHPGTCERYKACYMSVTLVPVRDTRLAICQSPWYLWEIQGLLFVSGPEIQGLLSCVSRPGIYTWEIQGLVCVSRPGTYKRWQAYYVSDALVPIWEYQACYHITNAKFTLCQLP